jgi:signal transduction histidine kinase
MRVSAEWLAPPSGRHSEKFAGLVRADYEAIVASFAQLFDETFGDAASDPEVRAGAVVIASNVLDDVVLSVGSGEVRIDADLSAWAVALAGRENSLNPARSVSAALMFADIAFSSFAAYLAADPELLPCFRIAVQTVNESVRRFVQVIAGACAVWYSKEGRRAQSDERRRLARELHDRVGEVLGVGIRRLDLQEIDGLTGKPGQDNVAREVLVTAMSRLRTVTSDLREAPVTSIEKALNEYLDSLHVDTEVDLRVRGDEGLVPPAVLDQVFLILRESVRNALRHGAPQWVQIVVEITSTELRAQVVDDGRGFEEAHIMSNAFGVGIPSMRERAALLGGRFHISSQTGDGTRVEICLPLPGQDMRADSRG